jgi:orotidine-5'-phosphate decarboxylase
MVKDQRSTHAADRLIASIEMKRSPVCVGIDPVAEKLPEAAGSRDELHSGNMTPMVYYCMGLIDAIAPHVACVKFQSACFERYRSPGAAALGLLVNAARSKGLLVILDAKRGDIGSTAEHYAAGVFGPLARENEDYISDWLTINSYLGEDGITPFIRPGHGALALVRTSNPGGDEIQNLRITDGRTVAEAVGEMIARIGSKHVGQRGYSSLGAVVGATKPHDATRLREIMPQQIFLVPGYGAQGGGIDDVLPCFKPDGTGAVVTASRSIIHAFDPKEPKWTKSVADAAAAFADDVGRAVGMR